MVYLKNNQYCIIGALPNTIHVACTQILTVSNIQIAEILGSDLTIAAWISSLVV